MGFIIVFLLLLLLIQLVIRRSNYFNPIEKNKEPDKQPDKQPDKPLCNLAHVPTRLHWDGHFKEDKFFHDEKLYWRIKKENKENPFGSITLTDISVNRSGISSQYWSEPQDALINITGEGTPIYQGLDVIELSIKKIQLDKEPQKVYQYPETQNENIPQVTVILHLIHDPLDCNKAHSMVRFIFDNNIVTFDNYKSGFGGSVKSLKRLRQICRDDIHKMIIRRIVDFDD